MPLNDAQISELLASNKTNSARVFRIALEGAIGNIEPEAFNANMPTEPDPSPPEPLAEGADATSEDTPAEPRRGRGRRTRIA